MLNKSQIDLIEALNAGKTISSVDLSHMLFVSKRTVISYVKSINEQYPSLIIATNNGYLLNQQVYQQIYDLFTLYPPLDADDRISYTLTQLLCGYTDSINITTVSYHLHYSETTIRSDFVKMNSAIGQYHLKIIFSGNTAILIGREIDKRAFFFSVLFDEATKNVFDLTHLKKVFPQYDIEFIQSILKSVISECGFNPSDYSLLNLLYHVIIAMQRISCGHILDHKLYLRFVRVHDTTIANNITEHIENYYHIKYPPVECDEMALLTAAIISDFQVQQINMDNLQRHLWPDCYRMIQEITVMMQNEYQLDLLQNEQNYIGFSLHIRSLIRRINAGIVIKNPHLNEIKQRHPIVYDCAVQIAFMIQKNYLFFVSEDEIAFLSLYIGNIYESHIHKKELVKILFVLPYYDLNNNLFAYYTEQFRSTSYTEYTPSLNAVADPLQYDLIVSTVSQRGYDTVRLSFLQIDPFINDIDRRKLFQIIDRIRKRKNRHFLAGILPEAITNGCFLINHNELSQIEVLKQMVLPLQQKRIVDDEWLSTVLKREELSDTVIGTTALPRSVMHYAAKTSLSICLSTKPIQWGNQPVRMVLLFTVASSNVLSYANILGFISDKLKEHSFCSELMNCNDKEAFLHALLQKLA